MADKPTILTVEDDTIIRSSIVDILRLGGYNVLSASNGREGLEVLAEHTPDLILADVMMPEMDGFTFYENVRKNPQWLTLPFIFLTARGEKTDIRHGYDLGADQYITKPFDPDDLLSAIKNRLRRVNEIKANAQKEVEETKQQLLNVLSHELRTPLSVIYGYIYLLQEGFSDLNEDTIQSILKDMNLSTDRLVKLVEDVMLIAYLESGVLKHDREKFSTAIDVGGELQRAVQSVSIEAQKHNIEVTLIAPYELIVLANSNYIHDIFRRLLDNAIKFSHSGGGTVRVAAAVAEGWIEVTIQDNGIGMSAEAQEGLFQKFTQINREQMEQQGAGLGLAITHGLVTLYGGTISVSSQLGQGSTFTVRLPQHLS
jgi:signal transduction histidine kinase